jgi:peptide/nickel transport system substrate-binding protein
MKRVSWWSLLLVAILALSVGLAACGGDDEGTSGDSGNTKTAAPEGAKQGGKLVSLWTDDVDFIDPGKTYYQMGFTITFATQKALYGYKPDSSDKAVPDLADGDPEISEDGKTVTVKIKKGVKFSPPVNREVTSKDVKYGIERGFFNTVNNGYAGAYFGNIDGAKVASKPGTKIKGIETPDDQTIVFHDTKGTGGVLAGALALTLAAPVPEEYAKKFDAKNPSTYGQNQVATGPYMVENNSAGKAIGYKAGKRIHLVRNPNWDKSLDYRPAYVDEIDIQQGNDDTQVASQKIISGNGLISGDFEPPPAVMKKERANKEQLQFTSGGGDRWVALNTKVAPFDDVNVRRATVAGFDRAALLLARGGEVVGKVPTHMLPPGLGGFDEAGGEEGPGFDFMSKPEGDPALAAEYFKKAGMASGKYEGSEEVLVVGTSEGVAQKVAEITKEQLEKLGFKVRLRLVTQDAMYTKFCNVPKAKVQVCPNVGWFKDFADPQTMLDPTFNGKNILPENNSNWSQLDEPAINKAMDDAAVLTDPAERNKAWGEIDKMVTEQAPAIFYQWVIDPVINSKDVNPVINAFNATHDYSFTSLK